MKTIDHCSLKSLLVLMLCIFTTGSFFAQDISTNRNPVSMEHNILFNAKLRYTVSHSGVNGFIDTDNFFNGLLSPHFFNYTPGTPVVITIEDLPIFPVQQGGYVGWTTRTKQPKDFKFELYNNNTATWNVIEDVTNYPSTSFDYLKAVPGGTYTKLRLTISSSHDTNNSIGISEIYFINPEATRPYDGLLGKDHPPINYLTVESWKEGNANVSGFFKYGSNQIVEGIDPHNNAALLWEGQSSSTSGPDGGFWTKFGVDPEKTYRFMVWLKRSDISCGSTCFGPGGGGTTALGSTTPIGNPYFFCGQLPESNKWYLLVGYLHGSNHDGTQSYGGVYDGETGEKVLNTTDFRNTPTAIQQSFRSFALLCGQNGISQYAWAPRVEEVNGNEAPVATILAQGGGQWTSYQDHIYYNNGSVGINTLETEIDPAYKLLVNGDIKTKRVKVTLDGWADFVFDPSYQLPPLKEVKQYVETHRHLPEIPSEQEVLEEGIYLGQMNKKLLQKVEELTLYLIGQQEKLEQQNQELQKLQLEIQQMRQQMQAQQKND